MSAVHTREEGACRSCGAPCDDSPPPAEDDDAAWSALAEDHSLGCAWVATRANRQAPRRLKRLETDEHLRVYAAERLSVALADRGEEMPEPGEARPTAVANWLGERPWLVVGSIVEVAS